MRTSGSGAGDNEYDNFDGCTYDDNFDTSCSYHYHHNNEYNEYNEHNEYNDDCATGASSFGCYPDFGRWRPFVCVGGGWCGQMLGVERRWAVGRRNQKQLECAC